MSSEGTENTNFKQINGIWLPKTAEEPEPSPQEEPKGHTCWKCGKRSGDIVCFFNSSQGWLQHWWTCGHEKSYSCPDHGYAWIRFSGEYPPGCPQCGCRDLYT